MDGLSTLLIDGSPVFIAAACRLLMERFPAQVCIVATATDGEDGLSKALALRPQLILVDLAAPYASGPGAISILRDLSPRSFILALCSAGSCGSGGAGAALEAGADAVIAKPRLGADLAGVLLTRQAAMGRVDASGWDAPSASRLAPVLAGGAHGPAAFWV